MRLPPALLATLAAGVLAGCAQHGTPVSAPPPAPTTTWTAPASYAPIAAGDACPAGTPVHLPDDLGQVGTAYLCAQEFRPVPGDGVWRFTVVRGVTSGLDALLRAYRTPDAPLGAGPCTADLRDPRVVYLHLSRTLAARAPEDVCGQPAAAAVRAFDALGTVEVTATKLGRTTSELAQTSGRPDRYKDMLAIEESMGDPRQVAQAPGPVAPGTEVCVYTVAKDPHGMRVGQLSAARRSAAAESAQINGELTKSVVDPACARHQHTRFALLQSGGSGGGPTTLVALGGCAVQQDGGWWRATDRLRALVGG